MRSNQDQFLDDDQFANPQLTEKFFIKTSYLFTLNILDKSMITLFQKHYQIFKHTNRSRKISNIFTNLSLPHTKRT